MPLMVLIYGGIPALYGFVYTISELQLSIYLSVLMSLILGFVIAKSAFHKNSFFSIQQHAQLNEGRATAFAYALVGILLVSACFATIGIAKYGFEYRNAFFSDQEHVFGWDRFGFILQLITEFAGVTFFGMVLSFSKSAKWRYFIFIWVFLGTLVTFGRWYLIYTVLILYFTRKSDRKRSFWLKLLAYVFLLCGLVVGSALIYVCRGEECSVSSDLIWHGVLSGVLNYFFIPIEMISEYQNAGNFGINLLAGFVVYPFNILSRATGIVDIEYQYDQWALLIQEYVQLDNIGFYNALVGQPLTSFVAAGYSGVIFSYFFLGFLLGVSYCDSESRHPVAVIAGVVGVISYLIPAMSGPMFLTALVSYYLLGKFLFKRVPLSAANSRAEYF